MSNAEDVERPVVGLSRAVERLRSQTFTGRDPENLATAVVDGEGMVDRITFAATITGRRPQVVAAAVLAAIADAQRKGIEAIAELTAARDTAAVTGPAAATDGIVGGLAEAPGTGDDLYGGGA
jgi:DNA-binding protein YbaB